MSNERNKSKERLLSFVEKRKGPNFWVKYIKIFSIIDWLLIAAILFILDSAMPKKETFFDRIFGISRYDIWNFDDFKIALLILILILFAGSGLALLANVTKLKRKDDKLSISNLIAFLFSGISIFLYVINLV